MKMRLLALHRKEDYPGQYLPEIMTVVDEGTLDENPEWWPAEIERQKKAHQDSTVAAWAEVEIEVPTQSILDALYPKPVVVEATVIKDA